MTYSYGTFADLDTRLPSLRGGTNTTSELEVETQPEPLPQLKPRPLTEDSMPVNPVAPQKQFYNAQLELLQSLIEMAGSSKREESEFGLEKAQEAFRTIMQYQMVRSGHYRKQASQEQPEPLTPILRPPTGNYQIAGIGMRMGS